MALVIAIAINTGFRNTLQRNLLGATAHVTVLEKQPGNGIEDWESIVPRLKQVSHVVQAGPALWGGVFFSSVQSAGGYIKGIPPGANQAAADVLTHLKEGSLDHLKEDRGFPGIVLGSKLAETTGGLLNSVITVISPQGEMTPVGARPSYFKFRVVGIFDSGFYDLDSAFAFTTLESAQKVLSLGNVVNSIELKLDDPNRAPEIARQVESMLGPRLAATTWIEQNRALRNALQMEKIVTVVTIGLIQLVAALNIFITLIMMVMEKHRDIAVLMSMGARREQIRNIFMLQGVLIGVAGTAVGLVLGFGISLLAGHYQWLKLNEEVYSLRFVPFEPQWFDALWISAAAIFVSFIATLYPARNATRIAPAEALRYE